MDLIRGSFFNWGSFAVFIVVAVVVGVGCVAQSDHGSPELSHPRIDFKIKTVELRGKKIKLQIWDTAGQERFHTITTSYYRGAMGIMLVYDITNEKSFENIVKWLRNIDEHANEDVEKMILGNKCDMDEKRIVSKDRGESIAREHGIRFMETSAKANVNIEKAFCELAEAILDKTSGREPAENTERVAFDRRGAGQEKQASYKNCCST